MKSSTLNSREKPVFKRNFIDEFLELVDRDFAAIMCTLFFSGFYMLGLIMEIPPIEVDIIDIKDFDRYAKVQAPPKTETEPEVEDVIPEKKIILEKPEDGINDAAQSRKALGEAGRVGDKRSSIANTKGSSRRSLDEKVARSTGIMGVLSSGSASFDKVFGGGGLGAGLDKNLGSVAGITGVDQFGSGGLSVRGFGTGGDGNALDIGGMNTRGKGGNPGSKYGMETASVIKKKPSDLTTGGNGAVIMGALDRSVIDSYIRRNLAKIKWCYEKELAKNSGISGRISITFIISANGSVGTSKVSRTTMKSESVENCVASVIKQIRFPQPKGGGIVTVNYPFVFKNTES